MDSVIDFLINHLGYVKTVMLKDFTLGTMLFLSGGLISILFISRFGHRIIKDKTLKIGTGYRIKQNGKYIYYTNLENTWQTFEFIISILFFPFLYKDSYSVKDIKRTRIFIFISLSFLILIFILSIQFITNPILLD